jgi:ClpP class serine protease
MLQLLSLAHLPWAITRDAGETLWTIYLEAIARKNQTGSARISPDELEQRLLSGNYDNLHLIPTRNSLAFSKSEKLDGSRMTRIYDGGVAVIDVSGPIYRRADSAPSGATSTSQIMNDLELTLKSNLVSSRLIVLDTPGGEATSMDELSQRIFETRSIKPIEAYADGLCASAGYYIASAASKITAGRMSLIGSIGVVIGVMVPAGQTEGGQMIYETSKGQFMMEFVSSQSPDKRVNPLTEVGQAKYQKIVDETADVFVSDVARFRGLEAEQVQTQYGNGGLSVAGAALEMGLIDAIGSFEDVLSRMQQSAGFSPAKTTISAGSTKPLIIDVETGGDMSVLDRIRAAAGSTPKLKVEDQPKPQSIGEVLAQLEQQRPIIEKQVESDAILSASNTIMVAHKAPASMQATLAYKALTAMADDRLYGGTVLFSVINAEGQEVEVRGTRVEQLEAEIAMTPAHSLATERLHAVQSGKVTAMPLHDRVEEKRSAEPMSAGIEMDNDEIMAASEHGQKVMQGRARK